MNKARNAIVFTFIIVLVVLGAICLYCAIPTLFIGKEVLENSIHITNSSVSAPKNYRATFAKWEYVVNDNTGTLDKVLVSNAQNAGLLGNGGALADIGIVVEDGSYGRHIKDIADFKSKLLSGSETDQLVLYLINLFETEGTDRQKSYNIGNLAVGFAVNLQREGKPLYWEGTSKWNGYLDSNPNYFKDSGGVRSVLHNGTYVPIASNVDGGWYTVTEQQLRNLHSLGSSHLIYDAMLGCGSVQWSGGRCWNYIDYMYKRLQDGSLDMLDKESIKYWDSKWLVAESDDYLRRLLKADNPSAVCIETIAGWVAARYECPAASCAFHYNRNGYTQEWYTDSGKRGTIRSQSDFFDGTVTDFSELHKWSGSNTAVSESTRVRDAINLYDKYYK